jgi:metal-responsive CopG/Arc/MetJ family transcriptional regulator
MDQAKTKLSITLAPDVVRAVDNAAKRQGASRSAVIEMWLRHAARHEHEAKLRDETIAYYRGASAADRAEDRALARAYGRSARRLRVDD